MASESGKPLRDALIEIDRGIDGIELCIETLRTKADHVIPMDLNATSAGRVALTQMEPIGTVLGPDLLLYSNSHQVRFEP